jgi:hypothetical protein
MKRGAIKQVYKTFSQLLPPDWELAQGDFFRRFGDWLHITALSPSRFSDAFEPRTCMDYLKLPGEVLGGFLMKTLKTDRHKVTRWVSLMEWERDSKAIYMEMVNQFRPRLDAPVEMAEVKALLKQGPKYYPHLYALCVMAAEEGNKEEARYWHHEATTLIGEPKYDSSFKALADLQRVIELMDSPEALKAYLQGIVTAKLSDAKLTDLPDLAAGR